jgi:chromosome partitioning protein
VTSEIDRTPFRRTIAVANGKGGVGKTSLTTHIAALTALAGHRVLLVDLDPQGNVGEDLGYTGAGTGDEGRGLVACVESAGHVPPLLLRDVRKNLDVIPGGEHLDDITDLMHTRRRRDEHAAALSLARGLGPHLDGYDLVVLDCPPRHPVLQLAALVAAQYLVIPTKTDASSVKGLEEMARRYTEAQAFNPALRLLGVVLFGVTRSATLVREQVRADLVEMLGDAAPVFAATVRHVERAAYDIRHRGQLAHELEAVILGPSPTPRLAASAGSLAGDFQKLATEVLTRMLEVEAMQ